MGNLPQFALCLGIYLIYRNEDIYCNRKSGAAGLTAVTNFHMWLIGDVTNPMWLIGDVTNPMWLIYECDKNWMWLILNVTNPHVTNSSPALGFIPSRHRFSLTAHAFRLGLLSSLVPFSYPTVSFFYHLGSFLSSPVPFTKQLRKLWSSLPFSLGNKYFLKELYRLNIRATTTANTDEAGLQYWLGMQLLPLSTANLLTVEFLWAIVSFYPGSSTSPMEFQSVSGHLASSY